MVIFFMLIRLGYVSISKTLENDISFHNITYTDYSKNNDENKLDEIIKLNFNTLINILKYNKKNNIHFYRLTSKLIPLATHKDVNFEYIKRYKSFYKVIADKIGELRIDVHPDQFTVLNSTKKDVLENTFRILEYHYQILKELKEGMIAKICLESPPNRNFNN